MIRYDVRFHGIKGSALVVNEVVPAKIKSAFEDSNAIRAIVLDAVLAKRQAKHAGRRLTSASAEIEKVYEVTA
jgi:hypothetical protein